MNKKFQDSLVIALFGILMAFTLTRCSGCALLIPEGEASWSTEAPQEEVLP